MKFYEPGDISPINGQVELIGCHGSRTMIERTVVKGEPFPPVPRRGMRYIIKEDTDE